MSGWQREHVTVLLARLAEPPERLIVVSGPRQTGKTALVRQVLDRIDMEGRYLSIDEPESVIHSLRFEDQVQVTTLIDKHDAKWLVRVWNEARGDADRSERVIRGSVRLTGRVLHLALLPHWIWHRSSTKF